MEQKPIGLIGAMKIEVDAILAALENTRQETHGGMAFTQGVLSGVEVVVAQCSPGKVNAALCAQAMIDHYSPRLVLNLGVAGGIGENVHIGDVVIATACVEYDFDTSALDQWPAGQLTLPGYEEPMRFLPCGQTLAHILAKGVRRPGLRDGGRRHCPRLPGEQNPLRGAAHHLRQRPRQRDRGLCHLRQELGGKGPAAAAGCAAPAVRCPHEAV